MANGQFGVEPSRDQIRATAQVQTPHLLGLEVLTDGGLTGESRHQSPELVKQTQKKSGGRLQDRMPPN
jgi:hypothetical protein